jgi:hypothetical protein
MKPSSIHEYMNPLIEEFKNINSTGLWHNCVSYIVKVKCIIADAPARNFIKCCVGFNAYSGCERCIQKGSWSKRVIFKENNACLRTDITFLHQTDKSHHVGVSPLLDLEIGLVSDVVLDYMHLVCLGVVKKLLVCWKRGPLPHREGRLFFESVSTKLVNLRKFIPSEFNRKTRTLLELEFWKATEFRTFLLYTGPFVLKGSLSLDKYHHFLCLSLAIRILLSDNRNYYDYAGSLLKLFVSQIPILYTEDFLVYNVHSLLHIVDDALKFGSLNSINAFSFENYMQVIKNMLRGRNKELSQIIRRVYERQNNSVEIQETYKKQLKVSNESRDNGWMLKNGDIISICKNDETTVTFRKFLTKVDFFTIPCLSSKFNIFKLSNLSPKLYVKNRSELFIKMLIFPTESNGTAVCLPMSKML